MMLLTNIQNLFFSGVLKFVHSEQGKNIPLKLFQTSVVREKGSSLTSLQLFFVFSAN